MKISFAIVILTFGLSAGLVNTVGEANGQDKYTNEGEVQIILGYCYLHADRPNPVQDLLDKGLISSEFNGDTCASVKQGSDAAQVAELSREQAFTQDCLYGNMAPSGWWHVGMLTK